MADTVAFIGLGTMGFPMAGHLARRGVEVAVWNRAPAKSHAWAARHPGRIAQNAADAARDAAFVMTCVGNDDDVRQVVLGPRGAFAGMKPGAVLIDHTTASAGLARELEAKAEALGLGFLDAPVSGGQSGAEAGQLTVMAGGRPETFERAKPVIEAYARMIALMGPAGSGQLTKMVNQICLAGLIEALAEGLAFGRAAGLDLEKVIAVISKGAAQSWQMDNRAKTMIEGRFDFGFAVDWMRKDLGIVFDESRRLGLSLPAAELADSLYAEVQKMGGGRWDTSSLIARIKQHEI
jgi:3-hydroxyisobutyrate dehydrogenase-like beta-hydroxyacid dehydrogenase